MANLSITAIWDADVYRIDQNDPVLGWDGTNNNIANLQAQALANRTAWLKQRVDLGPRITGAPTFNASTSLASNVFTGQLIRAITTSNAVVLTLPAAASVTENGNILVSNEYGTGYNWLSTTNNSVVLVPNAADTLVDIMTGRSYSNGSPYPFLFEPGCIVHLHRLGNTSWAVYKLYESAQTPPGIVLAWTANIPPVGWLECNGASLLRAQYPGLFSVIGTSFGSASGTTFNIPDLRGEFIRGWDNGRGIDLDSTSKLCATTSGSTTITMASTFGIKLGMTITGTGIPVGTTVASITNSTTLVMTANASATNAKVYLTFATTSRAFGLLQGSAIESHEHRIARLSNIVNSTSPTTAAVSDWEGGGAVQSTDNVEPVGSVETRPRNLALMYCIKY
jgi:hypothetical protein